MILPYRGAILRYAKTILPYRGAILRYAKMILAYHGTILRYAKMILPYRGTILRYAKTILPYRGIILRYHRMILARQNATDSGQNEFQISKMPLFAQVPLPQGYFLCKKHFAIAFHRQQIKAACELMEEEVRVERIS